ncbi:hypothetical protein [Bacillus subtilis]|uniref:hypothetical protein n=1 Tax=Bacillus subtilis TaxID=1423 RepID=UPI003A8750F4
MSRSADYTIQGFIYQFNKTLLEVLNDMEDSTISVEGIIEDIEVSTAMTTKAIQCKYHEEQESFTLSKVYKPILQMMNHYLENNNKSIEYRLYAYFPSEQSSRIYEMKEEHINEILKTEDKRLKKLVENIKDKINIQDFLQNFTLEFGDSLSNLMDSVFHALEENGLARDEIDTLFYPNAIQKIADLSILHDAEQRVIKKSSLLHELQHKRKTAVTRWTRSLLTLKEILMTRKRQLKVNLDKNSRSRYFFLSESSIKNFNEEIVNFITDYISKYHFKEIHNKTPLFCFECSSEVFNDIRVRLHKKNIKYNDGLVTDKFFDSKKFLSDPIIAKIGNSFHREYDIKLLHFNASTISILNEIKGDDFFLFSSKLPEIDYQDVNIEHIDLKEINQIKFVMGMIDTYE